MLFTLWELANATNQGFWGEKKAILTFRAYFRHLWERQCTHHHLTADVEIKRSGDLFESHRKWLNRSSIRSLLFTSPHISFSLFTPFIFLFIGRQKANLWWFHVALRACLAEHFVMSETHLIPCYSLSHNMSIYSRLITPPLLPTIQVYREKEVKNGQVSALK